MALSEYCPFTSKKIVKHRLHVCTKDRVKAKINGVESDVLLPNVRRISRNIHQLPEGQELLSDTTSHMLMQMGQFVDHDLVLSPELGHCIRHRQSSLLYWVYFRDELLRKLHIPTRDEAMCEYPHPSR